MSRLKSEVERIRIKPRQYNYSRPWWAFCLIQIEAAARSNELHPKKLYGPSNLQRVYLSLLKNR